MPASSSSAGAGKKRTAPSSRGSTTAEVPAPKKRRTDPNLQKFYAVRAGQVPGVYLTWAECQEQTAGFRGAVYKSFTSRQDADAFVAGKNPKVVTDKPEEERYYAVARAAVTGIFTDWETVSLAIKGVKGPKYKRFGSVAEAYEFIKLWGDKPTVDKAKRQLDAHRAGKTLEAGANTSAGGAKGKGAAASKNAKVVEESEEEFLNVFTDGSSLANGRAGASAGVGVYFGEGDPRNVSEGLKGEPQTNQRAELTAILRALEIAPVSENVQVFSDSQYSINCVASWADGWERRGWTTANGEPVKNQDLVRAVLARVRAREDAGAQTVFKWVKGHADDEGNAAADRLAVGGAVKNKAKGKR